MVSMKRAKLGDESSRRIKSVQKRKSGLGFADSDDDRTGNHEDSEEMEEEQEDEQEDMLEGEEGEDELVETK